MDMDATLTLDPASLPDDPVALKLVILHERRQRAELVAQRAELVVQHDAVIERIKQEAAQQRAALAERIRQEAAEQLESLRQRLEAEHKAAILAILRRSYGPRSERFDPRQLLLFGRVIDQMPLDEAAIAEEAGEELTTRRIKKRHKHGRRPLPESLPRVEIEHDLTDPEKPCPCCGELRERIGQEVSEQLEYIPASLQVLRHIRHKYACPKCEHDGYNPQITTATKPPQPIEKGLPGPGLLAYVVTSKLTDHLPLYRLENIFARQGVEIARSTLCAWVVAAGILVRPLIVLLIERIRQSRVMHTDDTTVPVQQRGLTTADGRGKCKTGRIWTYLGDQEHDYIVYEYTPDRSRAGPAAWLSQYQGYLQADAYGGYDGIYAGGGILEVACWAHARRKFFDARETDGKRAAQMLSMVRELYAIEEQAKGLDDAARLALRQQQSVPVLAKIKQWLDAEREIVLPRSMMGQAIGYALNQWAALNVYVTQGYLNIDNNAAERALKRVAIGRKNWLFAGNDQAAQHAATLWSLIASAERHGLDPQRYLTSLFAKLPLLGPNATTEKLAQFLPDVWKAEDVAEKSV